MRQIILDTETTGLDPKSGHRIIEIACMEMINLVKTNNNLYEIILLKMIIKYLFIHLFTFLTPT